MWSEPITTRPGAGGARSLGAGVDGPAGTTATRRSGACRPGWRDVAALLQLNGGARLDAARIGPVMTRTCGRPYVSLPAEHADAAGCVLLVEVEPVAYDE